MRKIIAAILLAFNTLNTPSAFAQADTIQPAWRPGYMDIHHFNTGRGVSSFFVFPDGTTMLVDAGDIDDSSAVKHLPLTVTPPYPDNSKTAGQWIADYIGQVLPSGRKPVIDYAVITHFHSDHFGLITAKTKTSSRGNYKLTGITEVGDLIPIKMLIDRNYPDYNFPTDLREAYKAEPSIFMNLQRFIGYHQKSGLKAASLKPGSTSQIVLKNNPGSYTGFKVRGVKANGTIWTGQGENTFEHLTADSVLTGKNKFNENPLSLALKISYGKFDYFTGGDNTGLQGYGLPAWFDTETPMAKAVGQVEVTTLNHHGNRDATNETFLRYLQPQAVIEQTWCSDHPGQEVMHRLLSDHIYAGEKNVFATNIQETTKTTLGFWFTRGYKSMFGHVITRVLPGGKHFYILIAETIGGKVTVQRSFGPYQSR